MVDLCGGRTRITCAELGEDSGLAQVAVDGQLPGGRGSGAFGREPLGLHDLL